MIRKWIYGFCFTGLEKLLLTSHSSSTQFILSRSVPHPGLVGVKLGVVERSSRIHWLGGFHLTTLSEHNLGFCCYFSFYWLCSISCCCCWISQSQVVILILTWSASPSCSLLALFLIRWSFSICSLHLGLHGSSLAMHILCKAMQANMTCLMFFSLHSVFL